MSQFASFQNILPDPNNAIGTAGQPTGTNGPGFATVSLTSEQKTLRDFTNSGRILARAIAGHKWKIKINYNPLTRDEFDIVYGFMLQRRGGIDPFFVQLPQYSLPKQVAFSNYINTQTHLIADATGTAGATTMLLKARSGEVYDNDSSGIPTAGDLFTITSSANSNHKKAYMITRAETDNAYNGTAVADDRVRIHFVPGLSRATSASDEFVFKNPLIKVVSTKDPLQYSLNSNNLYEYSLDLIEVQ
tara:strand:- start:4570 stop:5307 length:738 start_codon:yes stop_codon:yes gene_type:complete